MMFVAEAANPAERSLLKQFRLLNAAERQTLQAFAEFLVSRQDVPMDARETELTANSGFGVGVEPEPRPEQESVIAAMKRLRRGYPGLDATALLNEASLLMSAHLIQGRPAVEVIDDLETLFARYSNERKAPGAK